MVRWILNAPAAQLSPAAESVSPHAPLSSSSISTCIGMKNCSCIIRPVHQLEAKRIVNKTSEKDNAFRIKAAKIIPAVWLHDIRERG